ncbi:MAG: hypothetical protein IJ776_05800 [Paludibacteraceae bacterium]|nr:hypothetical protein [Paludibacteraceae bacterium]
MTSSYLRILHWWLNEILKQVQDDDDDSAYIELTLFTLVHSILAHSTLTNPYISTYYTYIIY